MTPTGRAATLLLLVGLALALGLARAAGQQDAAAGIETRRFATLAEFDRYVDTLGAVEERPAAELGYSLELLGHAFVQRYNRTEFRYRANVTGADDLSYVRVTLACDVQVPLLDHEHRWSFGPDRFTGLIGVRHFGVPTEDGSRDFVLAVRGKLGAAVHNHTLAGPEGFARVPLAGPDCDASRDFLVLAALPPDERYECDDPAGDEAVENPPPGARDEDVEGAANCAHERVLRRTLSLEQAGSGLVTEASYRVEVRDRTPPAFSGIDERVLVECGVDPEPAEPDVRDAVADNCAPLDELRISDVCENRRNLSCPAASISTRTWTAIDPCGNAACHTQSVVRVDTRAPLIDAPEDETVECDGTGREVPAGSLGLANITDECSDCFAERKFDEVYVDGGCGLERQVQRYWIAEDCCGNRAAEHQVVHVRDRTPPELELSTDGLDQECDRAAEPEPPSVRSASDACSEGEPRVGEPELVEQDDSDRCARRRVYSVNATDECWNVARRNATVTLHDTTAPVLTLAPADELLECGATPTAAANLSCSDSCQDGLVSSLTERWENSTCPGRYALRRQWRCDDGCGNDATPREQVVRFNDTVAPEFEGEPPADLVIECEDNTTVVPPAVALSATDACDPDVPPAEPNVTLENGTCRFNYTEVRRWRTADCNGNTVEHVQRVEHRDSKPPVLEVRGGSDGSTHQCLAHAARVPPAKACGMDNCADVRVGLCQEVVRDAGACRDRALVVRTYTATDECGLEAEPVVHTLTVHDDTPPAWLEAPRQDRTGTRPDPFVFDAPPAAEDNCGSDVDVSAHHTDTAEATHYAFLAVDACDNAAWQNYTVSYVGTG